MLKGLAKLLRMSHNTPDTTTIQRHDMTEDLITTEEAAKILGVTPAYIRRLCARRTLGGKRYGRDWLMTRKSVMEFAATERKPGRPPGIDK